MTVSLSRTEALIVSHLIQHYLSLNPKGPKGIRKACKRINGRIESVLARELSRIYPQTGESTVVPYVDRADRSGSDFES